MKLKFTDIKNSFINVFHACGGLELEFELKFLIYDVCKSLKVNN